MPQKLYISDQARAKRHVLRQTLYRLRKKYRMLTASGAVLTAMQVSIQIKQLEIKYNTLGGKPVHRGNVL